MSMEHPIKLVVKAVKVLEFMAEDESDLGDALCFIAEALKVQALEIKRLWLAAHAELKGGQL
ncbi:hypothetical protein WCLP8_2350003 [uncultured Gammaproteobacteria bacterium]